ncbi:MULTISPECIES: hypothetical protein [unclassified Streptomyces]|uniref:hypothetical protein n=1 Tax=unclassified Streptomyces TaxID=2593676 RepID=UPI0004BEFCD1|nr:MULTISPECIES: hypothetical protein [unclassified Streptomyces]
MNSERPEPRVNPRLDEDLRFEKKPGGPPRYKSTTDKPVQYLTVVDDKGAVIGYAWAGDADDAAGWVTRKAGGPPAHNEGVLWSTCFHDAKERGLRPMEALNELIRGAGAGGIGKILPGSLSDAPNAAAVKALADR